MSEIGIKELKNRASAVIEAVSAGERVIVTRRGRPAAVILPLDDAREVILSHAEELLRSRLDDVRGDHERDRPPLLEEIRRRREDILRIAGEHGARRIRIFGSAARGDAEANSDVDFLVEMEPGRSIFDLGGLLAALQDLLGRDVDVATEKSLRPEMRAQILRDAIAL